MARTIMIQGTASGVGKSLVATALCRLLYMEGFRVAPFKAWNMSLNACVTPDGLEIGNAQGIQAEAAGVPAAGDFNPILIKPKGPNTSQVILNGRPYRDVAGFAEPEFVQLAHATAAAALERLHAAYDWIVIEGAGSPAEPNLRDRDMANMAIADIADAPVLLVADMERGGAFAALVGTLALLEPRHRDRVIGLVLNRYHGAMDVLAPAIAEVEALTGKPVLGVLPYQPGLYWEEEDAQSGLGPPTGGLAGSVAPFPAGQTGANPAPGAGRDLKVAAIRFPHLANFTDLAPLAAEPDVAVTWADQPAHLADADLVLLPGTKNTVADLAWLRERGLAGPILARSRAKAATVGLCGGYQMLGAELHDPDGQEDKPGSHVGLGLLPVETRFAPGKQTIRTEVEALSGLLAAWADGGILAGYEIHSGDTTLLAGARPCFRAVSRGGSPANVAEGCMVMGGWIFGTYLHGLFENDGFRRRFLNALRARRGLRPLETGLSTPLLRERAYNHLAQVLREHLDLSELL